MIERFERIVSSVSQVVLGKEEEVRLALTCLFAGGHLLIEDLPGIGKTTLAKALSKCLGLGFRRVQFTSDMLPGDILGVSVFESKSGNFVFHPGPIFTQVLLADEINRATPKTQSALLEAMEEGQVTAEGKTRLLGKPFFVIATQNPLEQSGTFPLPESQMDRFLMRIYLGYPGREAELRLLKAGETQPVLERLEPSMETAEVLELQTRVQAVHAADPLLAYLQDLVAFTRTTGHFHMGLSPRAGLALLRAARSWAMLNGQDHLVPEDIQRVMPWVVGHRLRASDSLAPFPPDRLMALLMEVPIP